jgi:hypothetical protein
MHTARQCATARNNGGRRSVRRRMHHRLALRLLLPRLAPVWVGVGLAVSQLNAVVDWSASRRLFLGLPVEQRSAAIVLTLAAYTTTCDRALRSTLLGRELAFVRRAPVSDRQMAALAGGLAALALAPWAGLWARLTDPALGVGVLVAATPAALARVARSSWRWRLLTLAVVGATPVVAEAAAQLEAAVARPLGVAGPVISLLPAWWAAALPALWRDRVDLAPRPAGWGARWPRWPWAAFLARDLVFAARHTPTLLRDQALVTALIGGCALALRVNGDPAPAFAGPAASLAALAGMVNAVSLFVAARQALGSSGDEPALPLSPGGRAWVHALTAAAGWAPCGLVALALGPGAWPERAARVAAIGVAVAASTPACALIGDRLRREYTGPVLWAGILLGGLSLQAPAVAIGGAVAVASASAWWLTRGLRRAREAR